MDVHEIYRRDTGECVCRMIACDKVSGETLYERCIENGYPEITLDNESEILEYTYLMDVDKDEFIEINPFKN